MKLFNFHKRVVDRLVTRYERREAEALMRWLWEALFPDTFPPDKSLALNDEQMHRIELWINRLLDGVPIQHIMGYGYFYGRKFIVSPKVLIPRQETEELMVWVRDSHNSPNALRVMDIGTGSGCIPISLGLEWGLKGQKVHMLGMDLSVEALQIAQQNAENLGFHPHWITQDIFSATEDQFLDLDILISNPPYIPLREKESLDTQVKDHDPELALFVPNKDPLRFYKQIGKLGLSWLKPSGYLYVEVHSDYGMEVCKLLEHLGYGEVMLRKDLNKRDRMVRGKIF